MRTTAPTLAVALALIVSGAPAGELQPPSAPAPTFTTLDDIAERSRAGRDIAISLAHVASPTARYAMTVTTSDGSPEFRGSDAVGPLSDVMQIVDFDVEIPSPTHVSQNNQTDLAFLRRLAVRNLLGPSSPLWLHAMCSGRALDAVEVHVLEGDPLTLVGTWAFSNARVVDCEITHFMTDDGNTVPVEEVIFTYGALSFDCTSTGVQVEILEDGTCTLTQPGRP